VIRVYIELLPGGEAMRKKTIARFDVWNTSHLAPVSNYAWQAEILDMHGGVRQKTGTIAGHERSKGALALIRRLMLEADDRTEHRGTVSDEERIVDLSSHLLMLVMTLDTQNVTPYVEAIVDKAREALKRSAK
jgi:hypothetical protein